MNVLALFQKYFSSIWEKNTAYISIDVHFLNPRYLINKHKQMQYLCWLQFNRHPLPCGDPEDKNTHSSEFSGKQREGTLQLKVSTIMVGKYTVSYRNSKRGTYLDVVGRYGQEATKGNDTYVIVDQPISQGNSFYKNGLESLLTQCSFLSDYAFASPILLSPD